MAFRFNWPEFEHEFYDEAKSQLEMALNKSNKPSVIVDHITVKELHMGTKPPDLEILEIGELGNDKFRGIFKLTYAGDAHIEIQTKVQANPLHAKQKSNASLLPRHGRPSILAADQPLVVPMTLRISDLKLRGIVVLVVSKTKGVTLVFKNDPLESIRVSSTFDSIPILREFLQRQIEVQLRNTFQEDLPLMIHNLSIRYIQSEEEKKRKLKQEEKLRENQQKLAASRQEQDRLSISSSSTPFHHLQQRPSTVSAYSSNSYTSNASSVLTPSLRTASIQRTTPSRANSQNVTCSSLPELDSSYSSALSPQSQPTSVYTPVMGSFDLYNYKEPSDELNHGFNMDYLSAMSPPAPIPTIYYGSSFEDSASYDQSIEFSDEHLYKMIPSSIPMTAANLFTHNRQQQFQQQQQQQYFAAGQLGIHSHPMMISMFSASNEIETTSPKDLFADEDPDAPWYAIEGPELSCYNKKTSSLLKNLILEPVILDPSDEAHSTMTNQLTELTKINYTLSPLTETISHCTFRSLPYARNNTTMSERQHHSTLSPKRKIPKRRVTRLNITIPQL
ncbi:hypothetical protein BDF20DRAFT_834226 [Mycotypha africana]|uniref:uncharacterized protein n=1 Tax=Mycotypha africana TaxID=64632 RepID=UPI00230171E6|nr:uncharacterized protein BDF20DRAFT_834226 [Mycotypha africana]KAI8984735.1 hypothetical protein BDF20DRAFT_834226 [Mycotypha africana]